MKLTPQRTRVLVTGGAGFIGSHLADRLVALGCPTTVLDNFRNGTRENLAQAAASGLLTLVEGDVTSGADCARALGAGQDVVFHLACLGVRHSLHAPEENHHVNALGTLRLLEAVRRSGTQRFVYMSTSEVYGAATAFPLTEDAATWPTTVYGASKLAGEHYASAYHRCFGVPVVRVRPFNNYGPRAHFEGDSGEAIPRFMLRALSGQPPIVFGSGTHTRDFLFVRDCAEALVSIAEADSLVGGIVNLGYGEEVSVNDLASLTLAAVGRQDLRPVHEPERPGDVPRLWVDATRLRAATGFVPGTALADGLRETAEYYRALHAANPRLLEQVQTRNWEAR